MKKTKVLAVELPAPCPLSCGFCRTPEHDVGDAEQVFAAISSRLNTGRYSELYLTSNGETGLSPIFKKTVELAENLGVPVAVLCATDNSVVPGLVRVEVSVNKFTAPLSTPAIEKAKGLGVPVVISMVDAGASINGQEVAEQYGVDGVLIRALQPEGRSHRARGETRVWKRPGAILGAFPVGAYAELNGLNGHITTICIGPFGKEVPMLGGAA